MVGFPRSGTTLLDQILNSHPDIQVMEEVHLLHQVIDAFPDTHHPYPKGLATLEATEINRLRREYIRLVANHLDLSSTRCFVDKLPLNIIHTGLIHRLFPEAKIILALRHPCDVCLSNFMQHYVLNLAMVHFLSLDKTVTMYDLIMDLWLHYQSLLPLQTVTVRYEKVVSDFRLEIGQLLDSLGLSWHDNVLDFADRAKKRLIRTPSYRQVTQPIYNDSSYRWERYREHLSPYLPKLQPYIDRFGY